MPLIETFGLYTLCGVVLVLVTWPTAGSGRRFLRRWVGCDDPGDERLTLAVRRLRERRMLLLPMMALAPLTAGPVSGLIGGASDLGLYHLLGSVLVSLLLAELLVASAWVRSPCPSGWRPWRRSPWACRWSACWSRRWAGPRWSRPHAGPRLAR